MEGIIIAKECSHCGSKMENRYVSNQILEVCSKCTFSRWAEGIKKGSNLDPYQVDRMVEELLKF